MRKVISISEAVSSCEGLPVHATADAEYDEIAGELVVQLSLASGATPAKTVRTKVSLEEAMDAAKDIFHSWIRALVRQGTVRIEGS